MRAALSILGLVIAFAIVMFVMKKQVQQLPARPAPAAAASGVLADPGSPGSLVRPDAVRQQLQGIVEQATTRASDAQP
jgi:hypothetical protein